MNDGVLPFLNAAAKETVLFLGASHTQDFSWRDTDSNNVVANSATFTYKFLEKAIRRDGVVLGHNHQFDPKTGTWKYLGLQDDKRVYRQSNLLIMFNPVLDPFGLL